jgi:hypothetical protein
MNRAGPEIYVLVRGDDDQLVAGRVVRIRTTDGTQYFFPLAHATPTPWASTHVPSDTELDQQLDSYPDPWLRIVAGGQSQWHRLHEGSAWTLEGDALVVCLGWEQPPAWIPSFLAHTPPDMARRMLLAAGLRMSTHDLAQASRVDEDRRRPPGIDDLQSSPDGSQLFVGGDEDPSRRRAPDHASVNTATQRTGVPASGDDLGVETSPGRGAGGIPRWRRTTVLAAGGTSLLLVCLYLVILWRSCTPPGGPCATGVVDPCQVFDASELPAAAAYCWMVDRGPADPHFERIRFEIVDGAAADLCSSRRPDESDLQAWTDVLRTLYAKRLIHDHFADRADFVDVLDGDHPYTAATGVLPEMAPLFRESESWLALEKTAARTSGIEVIRKKELIRDLGLEGDIDATRTPHTPR